MTISSDHETILLPVEQIIPNLKQQLSIGNAIVVAPPGAGKSTFLPLSLLHLERFNKQKIILLQPRRLAVRNIAAYLAAQLGEPVGQTVGYRIRGEVKVSRHTRLEIVTEGILTRMLQTQPELEGVGLVIFDEFHERSIHADFSLALCIEVQQALREDLRLVVMSATLDTDALQRLLPEAQLLRCEGKSYPVDIVYKLDKSVQPLHQKMSRLIVDVFPKHQGDALVFLPGAADIHKTAEWLSTALSGDVHICKLFSELSKQEQQLALFPIGNGQRKIVLATNIAETSLTIEGIEIVIDSGLEKAAIFQLNRGITHLQTQKISQASATQRTGRAGRLGPGVCYRLWSAEQHARLAAQSVPEILQSDITGHLLESAIWGTALDELALIDQPSNAQIAQGMDCLVALEFFDSQQKLVSLARQAHSLGCQPSVANMLLKSAGISEAHQSLGCALAALLESKDPLGFSAGASLSARISYLESQPAHPIWQAIRYWHKKVGCRVLPWPSEDIARLIVLAFPRWISKKTRSNKYLLANGSGCTLLNDDPLGTHDWMAVASMISTDNSNSEARISLAEPLALTQIREHFPHLISAHSATYWDQDKQIMRAEKEQRLGAISMSKLPLPKPATDQLIETWRQVITEMGVMQLPFSEQAKQLIFRLRLAKKVLPDMEWPDVSVKGLEHSIAEWLLPYLNDVFSWQQVSKLNFFDMLFARMDWSLQSTLNEMFPEKLKVPSGSSIRLEYLDSGQVNLAVRMQEVYGLTDTVRLAKGKIPVNMTLLSPAGRVLQTTQDLAGFWQGSYKLVQKEMKGRYQKHFWPDDPATATPTTKTKKRMLESK